MVFFHRKQHHVRASKSRKIYRHNVPIVKQSRICSRRFYSFSFSIRPFRSAGNYKVAVRRFLLFPVEMRRVTSVKFVSMCSRINHGAESDNEPIILFKRGNSPAICSFFISFFIFHKKQLDES